MQVAIEHYMTALRQKGICNISHFPISYPNVKALESIDPELINHFLSGEIFVKRNEHSDFEIFERELGFPMPKDIADFINAYWQPGIFGYYKDFPECFILLSAIKNKGEQPDDFLLRPKGLIAEAKSWMTYNGDPAKYLPIGIYDPSSCYFILYEVCTGRIFLEDTDIEGSHENEPVCDSLRELILGFHFK